MKLKQVSCYYLIKQTCLCRRSSVPLQQKITLWILAQTLRKQRWALRPTAVSFGFDFTFTLSCRSVASANTGKHQILPFSILLNLSYPQAKLVYLQIANIADTLTSGARALIVSALPLWNIGALHTGLWIQTWCGLGNWIQRPFYLQTASIQIRVACCNCA